ncbi:hypothetical protein [Paenibacillus sedimenti]|uniref:hypothetical protein n=1 Tax=Paenibacillus sedimenti TaxID=2770274 RepID=UPI00165F6761|nr:hypothetical protein [Paenibacillus sedimenti]
MAVQNHNTPPRHSVINKCNGPRISTSYFLAVSTRFGMSGWDGGGSSSRWAGSLRSEKNWSNPDGFTVTNKRAGRSPTIRNPWGIFLGRRAEELAFTRYLRPSRMN